MRHEQARRAAVLGLERLAVVAERDPRLAAGDVLERQVRRVAAVAERDDVLAPSSRRPSSSVSTETPSQTVSSFDHLVTQWMSTVISSLGSARNSSHVQRARLVDLADDREVPPVERRVRRRAGGEDREVVGHVLAGRHAVGASSRGLR